MTSNSPPHPPMILRFLRRRDVLARLAVILLALNASWGVFHFGCLVAPWPVAAIGAAAFELCYIGLASLDLSGDRQRRARRIAATAVACSIIFNLLSGLKYMQPNLFQDSPLWLLFVLSLVHAVPLSWLSYQLADLIIHSPEVIMPQEPVETLLALPIAAPESSRRYPCPGCQQMLTQGEYGAAVRRGYCRQCKTKEPA